MLWHGKFIINHSRPSERPFPMNHKLYVGNIAWQTTSEELSQAFGAYGTVKDVVIVEDKETKRSRGFAFVTMDSAESAQKAMEAMNDSKLSGRTIKVNEAKEKERKPFDRGLRNDRG
jgi:cold-inducible RNA-binding protein